MLLKNSDLCGSYRTELYGIENIIFVRLKNILLLLIFFFHSNSLHFLTLIYDNIHYFKNNFIFNRYTCFGSISVYVNFIIIYDFIFTEN